MESLSVDGQAMDSVGVEHPRRERLVLAVADVTSFTRACAEQGDERSFLQLRDYYSLVARLIEPDGRVVKVSGSSMLLAFPTTDVESVRARLRAVRTEGTAMWRAFDTRCAVEVKLGIGEVLMGRLGPPGDERIDVIGGALNSLHRATTDYGLGAPLKELPAGRP